jgi:hypothetical protein
MLKLKTVLQKSLFLTNLMEDQKQTKFTIPAKNEPFFAKILEQVIMNF